MFALGKWSDVPVEEKAMKTLMLVLVVGLAGCAAQTGLMWGYVAQSQRLSELRAVGYEPRRSECEKSLSQDRHHMTLTNLLGFDFPEACQQFAIADFVKPGPDASRVYWSPRAGIAFSTPDWCAATQGTTWREGLCRTVVVTPLR